MPPRSYMPILAEVSHEDKKIKQFHQKPSITISNLQNALNVLVVQTTQSGPV